MIPRPLAGGLLALLMTALPGPSAADAPLIILDRGQLPFDLGPGNPANNPARPSNSPNAAWNSGGNTANSGTTWQNRPSNPANSQRLIITAGEWCGTVDGTRGGGFVLALTRACAARFGQ